MGVGERSSENYSRSVNELVGKREREKERGTVRGGGGGGGGIRKGGR